MKYCRIHFVDRNSSTVTGGKSATWAEVWQLVYVDTGKVLAERSEESVAILVPALYRRCRIPRRSTLVRAVFDTAVTVAGVEVVVASVATTVVSEK
jgi:hypothetical protein